MNPTRTTLPGGWRAVLWLNEGNDPVLHEWVAKTTDPPHLSGYALLKYSASAHVFRADAPPGIGVAQVVCKLSRASSWGRFASSRASKNARRAQVLLSAGIGTAKPLAVLERGRESWLISEYLPELVDLDQFALTVVPRLDPFEVHRLKAAAINHVADLFARLLAAGLHHRDLKASNILISGSLASTGMMQTPSRHVSESRDDLPAVILDLDGLRTWTLRRKAAERGRVTRLAASLLQYRSITRADYARFLRTYLAATNRDVGDWRTWFSQVASAASEYNRLAVARNSSKLGGYSC